MGKLVIKYEQQWELWLEENWLQESVCWTYRSENTKDVNESYVNVKLVTIYVGEKIY